MAEPSTLYVGLDVHKDQITAAHAATRRNAGVTYAGPIGTRDVDLDKLLGRLHGHAAHLIVAYEVGSCGYGLSLRLAAKGVPCQVVAPSLIADHGREVNSDPASASYWRSHTLHGWALPEARKALKSSPGGMCPCRSSTSSVSEVH